MRGVCFHGGSGSRLGVRNPILEAPVPPPADARYPPLPPANPKTPLTSVGVT